MNINLKQLETFVWVADLGSFRRAAKRLHTTQPNISSRIASLEASLGTSLMERDAGSVRLTSRGLDLLPRARAVLKSMDEFIEAANQTSLFDGVLRLGVSEMIVHTWLRDFLRLFKRRYPNIVVEVSVDISVNLEQELANQAIDLTFQSGPFTTQSSGNRGLGSYPVVWVAAPETELQDLSAVTIEDMVQFPILTHARNTQPFVEVAAHFATRSDLKVRLVPSSNLAACLQMTVDGYGVAALLEPMVKGEIESGQLIQIPYRWAPRKLDFYARYDVHKSSSIIERAAELAADISIDYAERFIG